VTEAQKILSDLSKEVCRCAPAREICLPCRARRVGPGRRPDVNDSDHKVAMFRVQQRLKEALEKRTKAAFVSTHEIYGIVAEEFKELGDALHANNRDQFMEELVDLCVGCMHGIASQSAGAVEW